MNYLDLLQDLASDEGEINPTEAKSIINGARRELSEMQEQVAARFPEDTDAPDTAGQKPRSEYTMAEKVKFMEEQRAEGNDPWSAWQELPE